MPSFQDQLNREVFLHQSPKRIISIVPSQTELLFYLGLDEEIVGITKFCTHPKDKVKNKTKIGGTKQLNIDLIRQLHPDLIIANKEENERGQVEELMDICPVWISDIDDLASALEMIEKVGKIVDKKSEASELVKNIIDQFKVLNLPALSKTVIYMIWRKPNMIAGKDTFINNMLQTCGFKNAFDLNRYPEVDEEMLRKANPDMVFLSSEPYPFAEKHIEEFKAILPNAKIILVDGEMFSWYGNRLLLAPDYFKSLV